jgi:hypothetical protein
MQFDTKIAVVIRADLEAWQKLNVACFLAGGIAAAFPECIGGVAIRRQADLVSDCARVWALGLLIWRWVDGSMDRHALEAISEDEDAAAAAGVNVTMEKLKITVISALMTSLAGALYCQ